MFAYNPLVNSNQLSLQHEIPETAVWRVRRRSECNMEEVRKLLGEEIVNAIHDYARDGHIDGHKMGQLAQKLGKSVGGKNRRRTEKGYLDYGTEVTKVLEDWWNDELYEMTKEKGIEKLILVFKHRDLDLKPLAKTLEKCVASWEPVRIKAEEELPSLSFENQNKKGKAQKLWDKINPLKFRKQKAYERLVELYAKTNKEQKENKEEQRIMFEKLLKTSNNAHEKQLKAETELLKLKYQNEKERLEREIKKLESSHKADRKMAEELYDKLVKVTEQHKKSLERLENDHERDMANQKHEIEQFQKSLSSAERNLEEKSIEIRKLENIINEEQKSESHRKVNGVKDEVITDTFVTESIEKDVSSDESTEAEDNFEIPEKNKEDQIEVDQYHQRVGPNIYEISYPSLRTMLYILVLLLLGLHDVFHFLRTSGSGWGR